MISWAKGELISFWEFSNRLYVLLNCHGLGYEIQVLEKLDKGSLNKEMILWIHHVKREDSDSFFGFKAKEERDFFRDLLQIKGIGPQIGMNLLKKFTVKEILNSLFKNNIDLISSVPGIGQKMTDRIFLELKNKYKRSHLKALTKLDNENSISSFDSTSLSSKNDTEAIFADVNLALYSLEYSKKEIEKALSVISSKNITMNSDKEKESNEITFEEIFKEALAILDGQK